VKFTMQIEYDCDAKQATVSINDRPAQVWTDCEFNLDKILKTETVDGFERCLPTGERSFVLHGTVNV
jgi:hypothetical protein